VKNLLLILFLSLNIYSYDLGLRVNIENPVLLNDSNIFYGPIDCGEYSDSELSSYSFGVVNRYKVIGDLGFNLNLSYQSFRGEFYRTDVFRSRNDIDFNVNDVSTKTSVNFDYNNFIIGGGLSYFFDDILLGGARLDLGMNYTISTSGVLDQEEQIQSPDNAVFTQFSNSQKRDIFVGNLETLQSQMLLDTRFTNFIKVGKIFNITQSIGFSYSLNSMFSDVDNKYYSINIGLGIAIDKRKEEYEIIEEPKEVIPETESEPVIKDTVIAVKEAPEPKPKPKPEASLEVISNWDESEIITGEELLSSLPLVNSIFFEQNSSEIIGQKYNNDNSDYFSGDAIEAHKTVILRISEIIKQKPDSRILITGYTSGEENEPAGTELSKARAEEVKDKFIELGVSESKIETNSELLPPSRSNMNFKEGIEENQRVDIKLINAPTQEYVSMKQFNELNGEIIAKVDFKNINSDIKLTNSISDRNVNIKEPGDFKFKINQRFSDDQKVIESSTELKFGDSIITHKEYIELKNFSKINVNYDLNKFEAILRFDYNSSELSNDNKELLKQLIEILPNNSEIKILGSADAIGSAETNKKLEEERAANTQQFITQEASGKNFEITTGRTKEKFPEDSPQGRFLNRSIRIKVEAK
jgi:outer membrane protein OmpA-like peptidoglycan-associated protein